MNTTASTPTLLHELVEQAARCDPTATALVHGLRTFTFGDLAARMHRAIDVVRERTQPGDRVAVVGGNAPFWIDLYYAVPACGRVLVFLNHRQSTRDLVEIVERTGTTLLVGARDQCARLVAEPGPLTTVIDEGQWEAEIARAAHGTADATDPSAPAWLIFTSGTTAAPKGAILSHTNILAACRSTEQGRPIESDDVYLFPFPLCHVAGYNIVRHHRAGRPVALLDGFAPDDFLAMAQRTHATSTSLAATMATRLLDRIHGDADAVRALCHLRVVGFGASATPTDLLRRMREALGVDLTQGYGMTELAGNAVFLDAESHRMGLADDEQALRAAGRPGAGVEIRTVGPDGTSTRAGVPGEIVVRAAQVMQGYWNDPGATRLALRDGWLHTGDIGYLDDTGMLFITDRLKDVIVTGGENVSSLRVEDVLMRSPQVAAVAVVGRPHPSWGESVVGFVVPASAEPFDVDALLTHARSELAGYQVPKEIFVVDALPMNSSGKVLKQELRARLAADDAIPSREA